MFTLHSQCFTGQEKWCATTLMRSRDTGKPVWSQYFEERCRDELEFNSLEEACFFLRENYFDGADVGIKFYPTHDETKICYLSNGVICDFANVKYWEGLKK